MEAHFPQLNNKESKKKKMKTKLDEKNIHMASQNSEIKSPNLSKNFLKI